MIVQVNVMEKRHVVKNVTCVIVMIVRIYENIVGWSCFLINDETIEYEHRHCNKCMVGCDSSLFKFGIYCPVIDTLKNKQFISVTG